MKPAPSFNEDQVPQAPSLQPLHNLGLTYLCPPSHAQHLQGRTLIGRLDIYHKPETWAGLEAHDFAMRRCRATRIDIFKRPSCSA